MAIRSSSAPASSHVKAGSAAPRRRPKAHLPCVRHCPVCRHPQTRIQRRLPDEKHGSVNYVCARAGECVLGINLTNVETWITL